MNNDLCAKIANEISDKLIYLCINKKTKNKSILELYNELLDEKYYEYKINILPYIPDQLARKGYEIIDSENFDIRKY